VDPFIANSSGDLGVLALGLVIAGVVSGLAAGMIGVGGGIVIVPILYHVLATLGVDPAVRMQIAVGTSLATIVSAALSSVAADGGTGDIDRDLLRRWAIPMLGGVLIGCALAAFAGGGALSLVFGVVAVPIALLLAFAREDRRVADRLPRGIAGWTLPAFVGGISVMMGISGTTVGVPAMTLCGMPARRAIATASVCGIVIAVPGTIAAIVAGWHAHGLPPYSLGYVNLLGCLLIAPSSFLAPFGARIADHIDARRMRLVFALFIVIVTGRMLYDAML
jgi:uncharacterized membrane protein YfcA